MIKVGDLIILQQNYMHPERHAIVSGIDYEDPSNWQCELIFEGNERKSHIFIPPKHERPGSSNEIIAYIYPMPRKGKPPRKRPSSTYGDHGVKQIIRGEECIYTAAR
jgi:hypothetical protein